MTKTYCDLCGQETSLTVKIEFLDGEHPHNGSTMYKKADVCLNRCIERLPLKCREEFDDIKRVIKSK